MELRLLVEAIAVVRRVFVDALEEAEIESPDRSEMRTAAAVSAAVALRLIVEIPFERWSDIFRD